ncbi:phospholipase C zinc-binding protein [Desulfotomaculum nigrificans CO-1-SRB]|uniref:Phospholipase C n=1 Tax=Desulfotomaculum nigrificans (strain DSM 14880 / VKM B-2319 / CO-1-SRB) TaxID=868595 RepID=F6B7T2_DESCC|nr:zinc dependent phospholipase C family protein [Desulfotomaculum nigrificans]AEF93454.1 phospholipase C zinc-binding protein [Desulfotomaculum nigrificans CO-1-SRB]
MSLTQTTWHCAKAMLTLTIPFQAIKSSRPRNTHRFCNLQAINILKRDGFRQEALLYHSFRDALNRGAVWCDKGFKNISHYYNHQANSGLWHGPDAPTECQFYVNRAVKKWRQGRLSEAMFYLGAAVHIIQDLCVPHHASGLVFGGHKFFEDWAREHYEDFTVNHGGIYDLADSGADWVIENAAVSATYLPQVINGNNSTAIAGVVEILLQRAQKTTAGFLLYFHRLTQFKK